MSLSLLHAERRGYEPFVASPWGGGRRKGQREIKKRERERKREREKEIEKEEREREREREREERRERERGSKGRRARDLDVTRGAKCTILLVHEIYLTNASLLPA